MDKQQQIEAIVNVMTVERYRHFEHLVEESADTMAHNVSEFIMQEITTYTDTFTTQLHALIRPSMEQQFPGIDPSILDEATMLSCRFYARCIRNAALRICSTLLLKLDDHTDI